MVLPATPGLAAVLAALPEARLAGGAVRDTLAGLPPGDIDLATPDPPARVIERLQQAGLRAIPTGLAHGTVSALAEGHLFEITTLRRDEETDGRHAQVAWTDDWREDAARRDFTINAMFCDRYGKIYDFFGGIEDLRAGRLRFVGVPVLRIAEDYLRVLRYFRFYARFGRATPDMPTAAALLKAAPKLATLSAERVWQEFSRLLGSPDPLRSLQLMANLDVLDAIMPEGRNLPRLRAVIAKAAPPDKMLRLAALLAGSPEKFAARLKLSRAETEILLALQQPLPGWFDDGDASLRRLLADTPPALAALRLWLWADPGKAAALTEKVLLMTPPVFPITGQDGLNLGAAPGPALGEALKTVRDFWLAHFCQPSRETCLSELARALTTQQS
jgi:poly(A) polymerase/tRNA nucleotidyltransferase (CCA-adding enzyme)